MEENLRKADSLFQRLTSLKCSVLDLNVENIISLIRGIEMINVNKIIKEKLNTCELLEVQLKQNVSAETLVSQLLKEKLWHLLFYRIYNDAEAERVLFTPPTLGFMSIMHVPTGADGLISSFNIFVFDSIEKMLSALQTSCAVAHKRGRLVTLEQAGSFQILEKFK